jgi:hypothetical protein
MNMNRARHIPDPDDGSPCTVHLSGGHVKPPQSLFEVS